LPRHSSLRNASYEVQTRQKTWRSMFFQRHCACPTPNSGYATTIWFLCNISVHCQTPSPKTLITFSSRSFKSDTYSTVDVWFLLIYAADCALARWRKERLSMSHQVARHHSCSLFVPLQYRARARNEPGRVPSHPINILRLYVLYSIYTKI
jgi:hypothetical protein